MKNTEMIFLSILKAALQNHRRADLCDLTQEQWQQIFSLAEAHKVLPLVYHTVYEVPGLPNAEAIRMRMRQQMMIQVRKTDEFCRLNQRMKEAGCMPIVVKGLICRNLYPQPDLRISSDEDLLIDPSRFERCCQVFREFGMETESSEEQMQRDYEVPFRKKDGVLFVELHKSLFPPEADAYGDWNRFFEDARAHLVEEGDVLTLSCTDHLFYLICHAFKHFVHSGFGIRQICDIVMFANAYGTKVDWDRVYDNCCQIHGEVFTAAIFRIGEKYLTFDPEKALYPKAFRDIAVDETDMLMDLLEAGVYGGATMSRLHSSNMTLEAVSADKKGKKGKKSLKNTLFPPLESLKQRYPYLKKYPILLPVAWLCRIFRYLRESKERKDNSFVQSLQIGNQRIELLRKYRVIR
jgi:hypothetical protein